MAVDKIQQAFDSYKMNPLAASKMSKTWFDQQVLLLSKSKINTSQLLRERDELHSAPLLPGSLYMFRYSAIGDGELQYWDRFPLVIPFRKVKGGFYGLNLHYLPPQLRAKLLGTLMHFATNQQLDSKTRLKFTWQTAAAAARNKYIGSCVKHYLTKQVKSKFMKVQPENWVGALMLPCESFVGASKVQVWTDSRRI